MHFQPVMEQDDEQRSQRLIAELRQFLAPQRDTWHYRDIALAGYTRSVLDCGGDWWTARRLGDGKILVLVADVMGHDLGSAIILCVAKAVCELACTESSSVKSADLLRIMNRSIYEAGNRGRVTMTSFVSVLDPETRSMTFASAGHPQPLIVRRSPNGLEAHTVKCTGNPLGLDPEAEYETGCVQLAQDDIVVWFTDGFTECRNRDGERLSDRRIVRLLGSLLLDDAPQPPASPSSRIPVDKLRDSLVTALDRMHSGRLSDDVTFVIGRIG